MTDAVDAVRGREEASEEPDPKRWAILAVVVLAQLMVVLDASIATIALPSAQKSLHISVANRQWVITAYTLAFGGLLLLGGRIGDFGGRRRMFMVGLLGFAAASALGGLATDEAMLRLMGTQGSALCRSQCCRHLRSASPPSAYEGETGDIEAGPQLPWLRDPARFGTSSPGIAEALCQSCGREYQE